MERHSKNSLLWLIRTHRKNLWDDTRDAPWGVRLLRNSAFCDSQRYPPATD